MFHINETMCLVLEVRFELTKAMPTAYKAVPVVHLGTPAVSFNISDYFGRGGRTRTDRMTLILSEPTLPVCPHPHTII